MLMTTRRLHIAPLLILFAASGAAALVYEVLWLKELGRLFGVTAYAAATTLGVFFLGLALGGLVWGRRAETIGNHLRTYAFLELGIAFSALLYLLLFDIYRGLQDNIFGAIGYSPALLLVVKFLMAFGILFLPSFFMGGTLPIIAQYLVRQRSQLGTRITLLYAVNTIGAAIGALLAGFLLPRFFGFQGSYLVAIALNLIVALVAWLWRNRLPVDEKPARSKNLDEAAAAGTGAELGSRASILAVAAASGFITLALEVVWTRMFSQVLQNSVYTFSIILGTFLIFLALGSGVAHLLCRRRATPRLVLGLLLTFSGLLVAITPLVFSPLSSSLDYLRSDLGFWAYVVIVFLGTAATLGPALVAMGTIFPYLMKLSERQHQSAGQTVGQLVAINTVAAIIGSVLAGFVFLDLIGVWGTLRVLAIVYLVVALLVWPWSLRKSRAFISLAVIGIVAIGVFIPYGDYSRIWLNRQEGEQLVEAWEGAAGSVAVAKSSAGDLRIRVNGTYNLGTTASALNERLQGQLSLVLHENPESVFFLGLGTGITASGALGYPVEKVVVCEVNSDVITASRKHFGPWLRGLFSDPRVSVLPEDGRTWLAATRENFDAIVGDIFLSFKSDVGSLYTLEHFKTVKSHLNEGGIFVQWLPLFDVSVPEFEIMAKTMLEVFPSVTLWRRSFSPRFPVFALVGSLDENPLNPSVLESGLAQLRADPDLDASTWFLNIPLAAYVTSMHSHKGRLADAPLNTDNHTILEYSAPITERDSHGARKTPVLAWVRLLELSG